MSRITLAEKLGVGVVLVWLALIIAFIYGYVQNIIKIMHLFGSTVGAELVVRLVGAFAAPLGAIAGYF